MGAGGPLRLSLATARWEFREPFVISRATITTCDTIEVAVSDTSGLTGRGGAHGVPYAGETLATMSRDVEAAREAVEAGATREDLLILMPAGGARSAIDAALWDLEAKRGEGDPFARNGVAANPVMSARTLGIRSPDQFEQSARAERAHALKLKVGADDPLAMIAGARRGAPEASLIVDPNQSWSPAQLKQLAPQLSDLGVELIEQPIPVGAEGELDGWVSPIPLCADELVDDIADLDKAAGRFAAINIKLDKAGGLTAALRLADAAQARGFDLMIGCMGGPSLVMAPGMVLAQRCRWVDLDAPLFQLADNQPGFTFQRGTVARPHLPDLWG
ncbi:dipeptide epimerase [Novosphingobium sp. Gsoil 351]|uniref:dipeptide epimerase n=1 Tax=Novosphingobium sp. Gsoil 351 TaxID=2675225 RepID=UPI0012B469BD|nr:dipeptide epimerase [Novosphingobium sp. Gsoil 351]QGN55481.1 dipeptide epimerase [Novosphingobium sp. Gsoil 351]